MIGNRIKKLRLEKGDTQKDLADYLCLTPKMISFYENEGRFPPHDIIVKLAEYFKVSSDYLLGLSDNRSGNQEGDITFPSEFADPVEARKYVMMHAIFGSDGLNVSKLDDDEIVKFANDLMKQMEMVSFKYRK